MDRESVDVTSSDSRPESLQPNLPANLPDSPVIVSVCTTCKTADDGTVVGPDMFAAVQATFGDDDPTIVVRPVQCLSVCKRPATVAVTSPDGYTFLFGDLQTESGTAANISGPTTVPSSAILQVVQTLTITGPSGKFACGGSNLESEDSGSALSRSITGSSSGRLRPRALLGRAFGLIAVKLAPVRCTPPRRRLQSTVRDGRSPGSRVVAISRLPGNFPVAPARARRLQLRGQRRR